MENKMQQIKLGNQVIKYEVICTNPNTMRIIIDNDKNFIVRFPKNTGETKIEDVLKKKLTGLFPN